jgi:16S rRNA (guanine1207-N2)-methyltransferase
VSSQYFAERPVAAHRPGTVHVVLPDLYLALATDSGVFSPGRLDPGTRFLLEAAPPPAAAGDLLDLGCGYGPLGLVLATRSPAARVWAVDVNRRAIELCERNTRQAGLTNVRCVTVGESGPASALLPDRYDLIWSNPPIRIGKPALRTMLTSWLGRLAPGAAAYLVVQRHLGSDSLQRWLEQTGWTATRFAARAGYRILEVRR